MRLPLFVLILATSPCSQEPASDAADLTPGWQQAMASLGVPGMSVAMVTADRAVLVQGFGDRGPGAEGPVDEDTRFYVASCTKSYVAMAILMLADRGELDLDAPVAKYLPRFELDDAEATASVTVRDLLCHRPGIESTPIILLDAYTGAITEDRYFHWLAKARPSGAFAYSNIHYTLLGRVLESLSGKPWRELLEHRLFAPAGMSRTTGFASVMYEDPNVALPCVQDGPEIAVSPIRKTDRTMHAAGGLGTTAHDVARWMRANLSGGVLDGSRLLPEEGTREAHRLQVEASLPSGGGVERHGYGLGWFVGDYRGRKLLEHGGGYVGSAARISLLPDQGIGVAVFANTDLAGQMLCHLVTTQALDHLLGEPSPDLLPHLMKQLTAMRRQMPAPVASPLELTLTPTAYIGRYTHPDWGDLEVTVRDGELAIAAGDLPLTVQSAGANRFAAAVDRNIALAGTFEVGDTVDAIVLELRGEGTARYVRATR